MNTPERQRRCWPHAPPHFLASTGTYMVTAGTYNKRLFFQDTAHLDYLQNRLLELAEEHGWRLEAWAVFANHYHFVARSPGTDATSLSRFLARLHKESASFANRNANTPGRKVWHNYLETRLTFQTSYLARLRYVTENPVKHGLVQNAQQYRWCSANWFAENATPAFQKTVNSFPIDKVQVDDDFLAAPCPQI